MSAIHPWNEPYARALRRNLAGLPHALLLAGPRGLGKTDFSMWLASLLLCESPGDLEPCGHCQHCQLISTVSHPDLHVVAPEAIYKNSDTLFARYAVRYAPEDKSRETRDSTVIRIDQVRSLIDACQKRPQLAARKVLILNPAEALNVNASNSLLKILEEPPADSNFVLVSHQLARLPATILSRCVRQDFFPPDRSVAESWLKSQGAEEGAAIPALSLTDGAPLEALLMAKTGFMEQRSGMVADLENLLFGKADPVSCAARWKSLGTENCLLWLHGFLADLVACMAATSGWHLRNPDLAGQLQALKNRLNLIQLLQFIQKVGRQRSLLTGSLDEQLLLDELLIRWTEQGTLARERQA